jgi:hypothetical protein
LPTYYLEKHYGGKMKKSILLVLVFLITFTGFTEAIYCQEIKPYIGIKGGIFLLDESSELYMLLDNVHIYPIGGLIGYAFPFKLEKFEVCVEGEFNYGIAGGNLDSFAPPGDTIMQIDAEYDLWTGAGYGVLRFNMSQKAYLKAKIGIVYANVNATLTFFDRTIDVSENYTDLSLGVGLGLNLTDFIGIETEFTIIESEINYASLGINIMP